MSTLFADGFEKAFVGLATQFNRIITVYDYDKCISILQVRDGMTREEAEEFFDYNVSGAWVGEYTPVFLRREWASDVDDAKAFINALEDET
jgi:hypothetical protein